MIVYRIVKQNTRTTDLSGRGEYKEGGRWNNAGTYALYISENRSLAASELLVHLDRTEAPPNLFIMAIQVADTATIYEILDADLPKGRKIPENNTLKNRGDRLLSENNHLAIKARSAIMPFEYNYLLNPRFPRFYHLVKVISVESFELDNRLL